MAPLEPSSSLVTGELARELLVQYHRLWNAAHFAARNPAPQPVSLEREHLPLLRERPYLVADKSDGVRYVLLLARAQDRELSVLVDRKLSLYQVPVAASRAYFAGSLFDGELVSCGGTHVFLVFDAMACKGSMAIGREPLLKRLELLRAVFDLEGTTPAAPEAAAALAKRGKIVCGGSAHGLSFRPKPCFQLKQLDTLLRQLPQLPYAVDGLVFSPADEPVRTGTHETMFKLKWKHTIDVEVAKDEDGNADLLVGLGGAPATAVQRASLSSLAVRFLCGPELLRALRELPSGAILELLLERDVEDEAAMRVELVGRRLDKTHPNAGSTVLHTVVNVREAIQPQELVDL